MTQVTQVYTVNVVTRQLQCHGLTGGYFALPSKTISMNMDMDMNQGVELMGVLPADYASLQPFPLGPHPPYVMPDPSQGMLSYLERIFCYETAAGVCNVIVLSTVYPATCELMYRCRNASMLWMGLSQTSTLLMTRVDSVLRELQTSPCTLKTL